MSQHAEAWQRDSTALLHVLQRVEDLIEALGCQQTAPVSLRRSFAEELEERMRRFQRRIESLRERRADLDAEIGQAEALLRHYEAVLAAENTLGNANPDKREETLDL